MAHARESVRKAIVTAVTGLTTTGSRVVSGRLHDQPIVNLPALVVDVARGQPEQTSTMIGDEAGAIHYRQLPVQIVAMVQAVTNFEDTLDTICAEVETALWANVALSQKVVTMALVATEIETSGDAERPVGTARMSWLFHYGTTETAPTATT